VAKTPHERLRAVGLSERKAEYLRGLATDVIAGRVPVEELERMDDRAVIDALTQVRGVGEWTAQMFLMFRLGRPDVLPTLDLGIQTAIKRLYGLRTHPKPERVAKLGAKWAPYRTVASWYLWRVVDDPPQ
jgi:3-methyladenine DNA glycosylase/8-oxoguanine DNA glycosylase